MLPMLPSSVMLQQHGLTGRWPSQNTACIPQLAQILCSSIPRLALQNNRAALLTVHSTNTPHISLWITPRCTCIRIDQYKILNSLTSISITHWGSRQPKNPNFFLCTYSFVKLYTSLHLSFSPHKPGSGIPFLCQSPFLITRGKLKRRKGIC